jgi:hypothetical protein
VRLGDPSVADAGCANPRALVSSINHDPNPLQVGIPTPFGYVVGMAHIISKNRAFAADLTSH